MPFTPIHMGVGLAAKAAGGRRFSLLVFGVAQVAMDIEPLVGILRGSAVLHGWTHTWAGATLIGLLVWLLAPALCAPLLRRWNRGLRDGRLARFASDAPIDRLSAATGAFLGTFSHVALDSLMHADMAPWRPWADGNALLGLLPGGTLEAACLVAGLVGAAVLAAAPPAQARTPPGADPERMPSASSRSKP